MSIGFRNGSNFEPELRYTEACPHGQQRVSVPPLNRLLNAGYLSLRTAKVVADVFFKENTSHLSDPDLSTLWLMGLQRAQPGNDSQLDLQSEHPW